MKQIDLKGKILFVFSDPGGAKPLLSLIENENLSDAVVISDRIYPFFKDFSSIVEPFNIEAETIIDKYKPDLIYTGTSYSSDIEIKFISAAAKKGIRSVSFIDHWTSMKKRFEDEKGNLILPDQIAVIDERAKQIAVAEGLDENSVVIAGNPYHKWLLGWKPTVSEEEFMDSIGIRNLNKRIALYAPDPLSNVNGISAYGFDEISVTREIVEAISGDPKINNEWQFLVKAHPNQDMNKLKPLFDNIPLFTLLHAEIDTNTCIYYSDIVMGFFSSLLIEADIMKKKVVRYLPELLNNDPIRDLNIGTIVNKSSFLNHLMSVQKWN